MQKKIFWLLIVGIIVFGLSMWNMAANRRYSFERMNMGYAFEIDHRTGKVWLVGGGEKVYIPEKVARKKKENKNSEYRGDIFDRVAKEPNQPQTPIKSKAPGTSSNKKSMSAEQFLEQYAPENLNSSDLQFDLSKLPDQPKQNKQNVIGDK